MKTLRLLLITAAFLSAGTRAFAAYLEFVPQQVTQPDGTLLNCFATGDEYYHWLHDAQRYTIIHDPETGYFVYAAKQGEELVPTRLIPGRDDPASGGLTPGLNISSEKYRERFNNFFGKPALKSGRYFTTTGNYNNLAIFIRFSNQNEYTEPLTVYSTQFNGVSAVSMAEYFKEVSKNQLNVNSTFYPGPNGTTIVSYQDSHSRRYYQPYSATNSEGYRSDGQYIDREMTLLKNASLFVKAQVEASGIDYDHDDDGKVDNVCFIIQGRTDGWSDLLWPHCWNMQEGYVVFFGDAQVYDFNFQLSEALGVSVLCHEMFHSLGAPDLYRYVNDDITPVGPWDLMAHNQTPPQHMSAYMKMKYGKWFSQIPSITSDGTYSLQPLSSDAYAAYKIASPNSTTEFFVLEYRKAEGRFESSLLGTGLIIYRVNQSLDGNAQGPPDEVYVYRPNGTTRYNGNINAAPFSADVGRTSFNDNTNPSDFLSNGSPGGIKISNIGTAGSTITFTVGSGGTFNPPRNLTATLTGRNVTLIWEKPAAWNGTLNGFKVFRNQVLISTVTDPDLLTYADNNLPDGSHKYHVTALYQNPSGESPASNSVTVTVGGAARPDLIITHPGIDPANVEPGGMVNLTCTMENRGTATAGTSMLRVYLSSDEAFDSGDRQLASTTVNSIDAGTSVNITGTDIPIPASVNNGKWQVLFIADADGAVEESIEDNNQASTLLVVGNPALNPPRNLVAQVVQTTVRLTWGEPEPGGGTLAGFRIYRNTVMISTINDPARFEFSDAELALGIYTYYVTAVYSSPVGESAKSNEVTVTVASDAKPDLTIQDFSVTPGTVPAGGSIDIKCTLLNIGASQAPANQVQLYLSGDLTIDANDFFLAYGSMDPLDPGTQVSISGEDIALPDEVTSGTWYALIMADAAGEIDESNESNNMASKTVIIQGSAPDLQITNMLLYPPIITPSSNVRISFFVSNNGLVPANQVKTIFFLSADEVLDPSDKEMCHFATRLLGAHTNSLMYTGFKMPADSYPGQYYLIGYIDKENLVMESDESNNWFILPVIVASPSGISLQMEGKEIRVYPVPAEDWLIAEFKGIPGEKMVISCVDICGREVYREEGESREWNQLKWDIRSWVPGLWILQVKIGNRVLKERILIR